MTLPRSPYRSVTSALFACALLLRVVVPAGYMPTNLADGWYLQLCPDGLSARVMGALFGHDHVHHHAEEQAAFAQCDIGGGFTGDALATANIDAFHALDNTAPAQPLTAWLPATNIWHGFRPRAPPHSGLI